MTNRLLIGIALLCFLPITMAGNAADPDGLLQPPGLRLLNEPATVIPATYQYVNQKRELPLYRSTSGAPMTGWKRKFIQTRRFSSNHSAWIFYRPSDLKRIQVIGNSVTSDPLQIWPVGATLILEGYKGDASRAGDTQPIGIEMMTKTAPALASATKNFFAVEWSYARYSPDGNWSLSRQKLMECHQCHSIAFQLTGDLIFTQLP